MIVEMVDPKGINKLHILGKRIEVIKEFSSLRDFAFSRKKLSWGDQVTVATILKWSLMLNKFCKEFPLQIEGKQRYR